MSNDLTHIPDNRMLNHVPVGNPFKLEAHERAEVRIALINQNSIQITVDTPSGFASKPQILLQEENGSQTVGQTQIITNEGGKTIYSALFNIETQHIAAMVDVRGLTSSGMLASAVESFTMGFYKEPGEYNCFGPRGALMVSVEVKDDCSPLPVCIGPAPPNILERAKSMTPVSNAFTISSIHKKDFSGPVKLAIAANLNELPAEMTIGGQPDLAIFHWDSSEQVWSRLDSASNRPPPGIIVEVDIELPGIYAAFALERQLDNDDLRRKNIELKNLIIDQARELQTLRLRLEQESQVKPSSQPFFLDVGAVRIAVPSTQTDQGHGPW